jgi:hypothetical protein
MTDDEATGDDGSDGDSDGAGAAVRCWLVEREYTDKGLVTIVYATPDGERAAIMQRSSNMLARTDVTAARDVDPDELEPVDDPETRDRYAHEVERMRENNDPDDAI